MDMELSQRAVSRPTPAAASNTRKIKEPNQNNRGRERENRHLFPPRETSSRFYRRASNCSVTEGLIGPESLTGHLHAPLCPPSPVMLFWTAPSIRYFSPLISQGQEQKNGETYTSLNSILYAASRDLAHAMVFREAPSSVVNILCSLPARDPPLYRQRLE